MSSLSPFNFLIQESLSRTPSRLWVSNVPKDLESSSFSSCQVKLNAPSCSKWVVFQLLRFPRSDHYSVSHLRSGFTLKSLLFTIFVSFFLTVSSDLHISVVPEVTQKAIQGPWRRVRQLKRPFKVLQMKTGEERKRRMFPCQGVIDLPSRQINDFWPVQPP